MGSGREERIGLAELIYKVKQELLSPEARGRDPVPLFAVDEIQVEATVVIAREATGGINIQVINAGMSGSRETGQTVRVTLKPLRTREELVADLGEQAPQMFEEMRRESLALLKAGLQHDEPLSYPG